MKSTPLKLHALRGQTLTEYAWVAVCAILVAIPSLTLLSGNINRLFLGMDASISKNNAVVTAQNAARIFKGSPANRSNVQGIDLNVNGLPNVSSIPNMPPALAHPIQVSGALGAQVYANSVYLQQMGASYKDSNPDLYNAIINLGQKEQSLALSMAEGRSNTNAIITDFMSTWDAWNKLYGATSVFNQLSPGDQATVTNLANNSMQLGSNVWGCGFIGSAPALSGLTTEDAQANYLSAEQSFAAAKQVSSNGSVTVQCGANMTCPTTYK